MRRRGGNQAWQCCPVRINSAKTDNRIREAVERRFAAMVRSDIAEGLAWAGNRCCIVGQRHAARYLRWLADDGGRIRVLGLALGWTIGRDLTPPQGKTFS